MYTFGLLCNLTTFFDLAASAGGAEAEAEAAAAAVAGASEMDGGGGGGGGSGSSSSSTGRWRHAIEFLLELEAPLPGRAGAPQRLVPDGDADTDELARSVRARRCCALAGVACPRVISACCRARRA